MIHRKDQGVVFALEGCNQNCKSIGGAHGGTLKSKRIANVSLSLFIVSNVGRKSDSLCWSSSFPVSIVSVSQTKHPSGGVTKALLTTGSTTQIQNTRPDFQTNVVDIDETQVTTVPPAEHFYRAVEVSTRTCSTQPSAHQVCKISPLPGQVTQYSETAVPMHANRVCPLRATPGG